MELNRLSTSSERIKDMMDEEFIVFHYILDCLRLIKLVYVLYLLVMCICVRKRRECFILSILFPMAIFTPVSIVLDLLKINDSETYESLPLWFRRLEWATIFCGTLQKVMTLIFVLKYDKSARLLPLVLKELTADLQFAKEREQLHVLSE